MRRIITVVQTEAGAQEIHTADVPRCLLIQGRPLSPASCVPMKIYTPGLKQNEESGLYCIQCK